jgi:HD-GYP domain-containing protein (c-di-GMP phosphodiesterase class II)/HAMP domain-containing protein
MNQTQNQPAEAPAVRSGPKTVVRLKIFATLLILFASLITAMTYSEISRWRSLSENYINRKGLTLVKTIEPHTLNFIETENIKGLEKLARSITSPEIPDNDVISVQILNSSMQKIAESSPNLENAGGSFINLPATVVVANQIIDPDTKQQVGVLRMVFSNRLFETMSRQVFAEAALYFILAIIVAALLTWYLLHIFHRPVLLLAEAARKISKGQIGTIVEVGSSDEIEILIESFNQMSQSINVHLSELRQKASQLEQKNYELSTLQHIGRALSSNLEAEQLYESVVDNVINILSGVKRCSLMLVDEKHEQFIIKVAKGLDPETIPASGRVPIERSIGAKVFHNGDSVLLNDLDKEEDSTQLDEARVKRSSICVPIKHSGKVIGILSVSNRISGTPFNETDLRLVEGVAREASIALKNSLMWNDLKRKVLELNTLHEVGKTLGMVLDINKLLEMVLDLTAKVLGGVKTSSVILYDEETNSLQVMLYKGNRSIETLQPIQVGEGIAGKVFEKGEPIIINDLQSTGQNPSETGRSSICVPLKIKEKTIGVLSVSDKHTGEAFDNSDLEMLVTLASQIAVTLYNAQLYEDLESSYLSAVRALANSIDAKDPYTRGHSERVARYSVEIGRTLNLNSDEIKNLHVGALLHDIGKISISESIINKNSKLSDSEYETMKTHPARGAEIIEPARFLREKVPLIRYHHERYDGKGYPEGLKGNEIPLMARIVCVADSYDAMTSKRAYRDTMPRQEARNELIRCSGTQFDPRIVNAFLEVLEDDKKIEAIEKLGK